jgi:hypothetical protein
MDTLIGLAEECERAGVLSDQDAESLGVRINEALGIASYITDDGNPVASLDAAMTLVPEGCDWLINGRYNFAQVWEAKETGRDGSWKCERAATPALALCAAALRAREGAKP